MIRTVNTTNYGWAKKLTGHEMLITYCGRAARVLTARRLEHEIMYGPYPRVMGAAKDVCERLLGISSVHGVFSDTEDDRELTDYEYNQITDGMTGKGLLGTMWTLFDEEGDVCIKLFTPDGWL